jgi:hypothetical protein
MAVNERAPGHDVVDVGVTVRIFQMRPARPRDEEGMAADRFEGANGAIDASREDSGRGGKELFRA